MVVLLAGLLAGCATTKVSSVPTDVGGRWTGSWIGYGVLKVGRVEDVQVDLVQAGSFGTGWLMLDGAVAADAVPDAVRDAGMTGVRILFDVSANRVRLYHELGSDLFEAELVVLGDRMTGQALRTDPPVRFELTREKPPVASVPVAVAAVSPPPPPPAPAEAPTVAAVTPPPPPQAPEPSPPARVAPPPREFDAVPEIRVIHFDFDRSEIRPADAAILDANAAWLRANPERLVLIEGHCDERGTAEYNLALGERRALATKTYLLGRGIAESRMTITSYGVERPLCTERAEACWARNRRAALLVK
jgi:peptidoglycan-associated lipoprotein